MDNLGLVFSWRMDMHMYERVIAPWSVLVRYCCCNKLSCIWWLKTTQICYLLVLKAKVQNGLHWDELRYQQAHNLFRRLQGAFVFLLFLALGTSFWKPAFFGLEPLPSAKPAMAVGGFLMLPHSDTEPSASLVLPLWLYWNYPHALR